MIKNLLIKNLLLIVVIAFTSACNNGKVDERKLNEAGEKLQKTVKKVADSAESKIEQLKDKVDKNHRDTTP